MSNTRDLFFQHIGQTSPSPMIVDVSTAEGIWIKDTDGVSYMDLTSGFSVTNVGHRNPKVIASIKEQLDAYLHTTVYGEHIQTPQVKYAKAITTILPSDLDTVYFVNSGSEAIEGAMKLAKKVTGKSDFVAASNAYHGSTQGAMSLKSDPYFTSKYRPLLPGISFGNFNDLSFLELITPNTAGVVIEVIQAESGIYQADKKWLESVKDMCQAMGAMLIFDEIQTGFGRTGKMFAFEHYEVFPDILCIAKGMGGGMPIGAFISNQKNMITLSDNPILGHITTFGGHPVSCAAALATLEVLLTENWLEESAIKAKIITDSLNSHPIVENIRQCGLFICMDIKKEIDLRSLFTKGLSMGLIVEGFLFHPNGFRIAPPLCITFAEIEILKARILALFNSVI